MIRVLVIGEGSFCCRPRGLRLQVGDCAALYQLDRGVCSGCLIGHRHAAGQLPLMWPGSHIGIDRGALVMSKALEQPEDRGDSARPEPKPNHSRRWVTPAPEETEIEPQTKEESMPPKKMYEWEGRAWSVKDIAEKLGITTVSVRRRLGAWGLERTMTEPKHDYRAHPAKGGANKTPPPKVTPPPVVQPPPEVAPLNPITVDTPAEIVEPVRAMRRAALLEALSDMGRALGMRVELGERCVVILLPEES